MTPKITRRDFLKIVSIGAGATILAGCQNPRRWVILEPYVKPPEEQLAGVATWYASTCRQCPAGCGIIVRIMNGRALKIEGNPQHPLNQGKLCARGQSGLQTLYDPDRLTSPVTQAARGTRGYKAITWEEGINTLFSKVQAAGSKVAVWGGSTMSGHLFDIFQKFTTAIGANPPLIYDMFQSMSGYAPLMETNQALFGKAALPVYDIGNADLVISFNADFLGPGMSQVRYGIEYGGFRSHDLGKRGYLVQIEQSMSITGAKADQWLPVKAGCEGLVAQGMMQIIADQSLGTPDQVQRAKLLASGVDALSTANAAGITVDDLNRLAKIFMQSQHPLAIPGLALAGYPGSKETFTAIQGLNYISGAAGQVGGMAFAPDNPLPGVIQKPGTASFGGAQALIAKMKAGEVQVLLVHGANPAYDLPASAEFADALNKVPFIVSFAPIVDETAVQADLILPDRTYLEGWGYELVSPAFDVPVVASQQPVVMPLYDARATADVILTAAKGIPASAAVLPWTDEVAFIKDVITQLPPAAGQEDAGSAERWARYQQFGGWWPTAPITSPAGETTKPQPSAVDAPKFQGEEAQYPFILQLHLSDLLSDGRGANQPWLQGSPDPMTTDAWQTLIKINPETAKSNGLADEDVVKVTSPYGEIEGYIYTYQAIRPNTIAIATGQGHSDYGRYASQRGSNPMQLVGAVADEVGGSLAWANIRVKVTKTGKKVRLALFEWKSGVEEGFLNQALPGQ